MAAGPNYAGTSTVGVALLQVGDNSRLNPSNALTIFTPANSQGAQVERILEEAVGACTNTAIRIYRNDGTTNHLYMEIQTASGSSSTGTAIIPQQQEAVDNSNLFPIAVPNGWTLTASINDTQIAAEMSINSVALAQTTAGAAQLSLSGALATAASSAAISASATQAGAAALALTATPYLFPTFGQVTLTSTGNISAVNFFITGRNKAGAVITETLAGPNNNTVYSVNVYAAILSIVCSAAVATATSAGISAVAALVMPSKISLSSIGNLSAVNFTITGTTSAGAVQSEVLAGPNVNTVNSVKLYSAITTIACSGAVATSVSAGNPPILSGFKVQAEGGSF